MAKPRLIIIIRHAQSEGNKNREIHQTIPDHRVKLTQDGWQQAYEAGRRLKKVLRATDTLHFFTSPYRRTRETTEGILATLTSDDPEPSPFKRNNIKVYEEPRLREQDFGNFQPCSAEMERMWQERADYGHFFYRIPDGESAADAYDRISGFNESLWRQFGEDDFASVCVLVTHGLMSRVFLMKWYHFSVEYFEDLRNVNHCEFLIMNKQESGKYVLENKLRTWSELRRERALKEKEKEKEGKGATALITTGKDAAKLDKATAVQSPVVPAVVPIRRWGGCPNGCDHDKTFRIRSALADLVKRDGTSAHGAPSPTTSAVSSLAYATPPTTAGTSTPSSSLGSRRPAARRFQSEDDDSSDVDSHTPQIDVTRAQQEVVSSPDGTPSFISVDDRLRAQLKSPGNNAPPPLLHARGRDFGGTYSGHTSRSGSIDDSSEDERMRNRAAKDNASQSKNPKLAPPPPYSPSLVPNKASPRLNSSLSSEVKRDQSRMGRGAMANRLGDDCDNDNNADDEREHGMSDIEEAERADKSIIGSVY